MPVVPLSEVDLGRFRLVHAPAPLDAEQHRSLLALCAGVEPYALPGDGTPPNAAVGPSIALADPLPVAPDPALAGRWAADALVDGGLAEPAEALAAAIAAARGGTRPAGLHVLREDTADHFEVGDLTDPQRLAIFAYLDEPLHRRRIRMLADLAAWGVERAVSRTGRAAVLDLGPGPLALERALAGRLDPATRARTRIVGVDLAEGLLRYGLAAGLLDAAYVADAASADADQVLGELEAPAVVVAAEVLEHVRHSAAAFAAAVAPWLRRRGDLLVGSVPNALQGAELPALHDGSAAPYQLTEPLFDPVHGHVAFYTYPTLRRALALWGAREAWIAGNGVRLARRGNAACLDAGLVYPHRADRLIFAADFAA